MEHTTLHELSDRHITLFSIVVVGVFMTIWNMFSQPYFNRLIQEQNHTLCVDYAKGDHSGLFTMQRKAEISGYFTFDYWYKSCMNNLNSSIEK